MNPDQNGNGEVNSPFSPPVQMAAVETLMDFPTAIKKLTEGAKIARVAWHNTDYGFLSQDGWLSIYRNGEVFTHWKVNDGDLKARDWIVIK